MTERGPSLSAEHGRSVVQTRALLRGALAAGLGLGSVIVLVVVLWISSPGPASSPGEAFRAAAAVWLLAHGAELVRTDTLTGAPSPVGVVPLLLAALPVWLVHRAARDVAESEEGHGALSAGGTVALVTGGYLLVGAAAALYVRETSLSARPLTLLFPTVLVVAGAAAAGVWTASGFPLGPPPSWAPVWLHEAMARSRFARRAEVVGRSAAAGVAVLLGGGSLVAAVGLMWHAGSVQESFLHLSGDWAGRFSVLLLALALVPNAAVWGAAYGLGPGFVLGTASSATPLGFLGHPSLPDFPLLAALPAQGPGTPLHWLTAAVPVAVAATVAWFTVLRAAPTPGERAEAWGAGETALTTALAAVGCGIGAALLAAAAGGPLGTHALARLGPVWWLTGAAAFGWTAALAVPAALLLRVWRLRGRTPAESQGAAPSGGGPGGADTAREPGDAAEAEPGRARPGWWPRHGRRPAESGAEEAPAPVAQPAGLTDGRPEEEDDEFEAYDFLPTNPWHTKAPQAPKPPRAAQSPLAPPKPLASEAQPGEPAVPGDPTPLTDSTPFTDSTPLTDPTPATAPPPAPDPASSPPATPLGPAGTRDAQP
ncbi:DUF6350 family protein [Streptomyces sp. NPDC005426]|uniref:cell division protein PerM n=1 Tax=Streptomyces sp. NPDC005426 TaxID=3155344 RepID=UPI0033A7E007